MGFFFFQRPMPESTFDSNPDRNCTHLFYSLRTSQDLLLTLRELGGESCEDVHSVAYTSPCHSCRARKIAGASFMKKRTT